VMLKSPPVGRFVHDTAEAIARAIPACAGATSDKLRLTSVQVFSQDFEFVRDVDAVAVGIGENVFPEDTPFPQ
jgi:hypothetical protein